jgi:release factor glutamine methyltransferase
LVASARQRLRDAGIDDAEADLDARVLAQSLLNWDAARFFTEATQPAPDFFASAYHRAIDRRTRREPVAYITGRQEFWGLSFEVTPAVLIPRPETEVIVEAALELWVAGRAGLRVADVCTGSGCLAVALAREQPAISIVATDISHEAILMARRNAVGHGVRQRMQFVETDLLSGVRGPFDVIVSNPPYIAADDAPALAPDVRNYEPHVALFGGRSGLAVIEALVREAAPALAPNGCLLFEFGFGQSDAVSRLVAAEPRLALVDLRRDLQGIPRTAIVRRTR